MPSSLSSTASASAIRPTTLRFRAWRYSTSRLSGIAMDVAQCTGEKQLRHDCRRRSALSPEQQYGCNGGVLSGLDQLKNSVPMPKTSRRHFLQVAGAAGSLLPGLIERALAIPAHATNGSIRDVKHIVVLMQEN